MMWTLLLFFLKPSPTLTCQQQQGLNKEVVRYDVDSLEAIRIEEFNVGQTSTPKEKKTSRGRPRKFIQGESLKKAFLEFSIRLALGAHVFWFP